MELITKPNSCRTFKYYVDRDPVNARDRAEMAAMYRKIRKDNPAIARLFYRRQRMMVDEMSKRIFGDAIDLTTGGGLSLLVAD